MTQNITLNWTDCKDSLPDDFLHCLVVYDVETPIPSAVYFWGEYQLFGIDNITRPDADTPQPMWWCELPVPPQCEDCRNANFNGDDFCDDCKTKHARHDDMMADAAWLGHDF